MRGVLLAGCGCCRVAAAIGRLRVWRRRHRGESLAVAPVQLRAGRQAEVMRTSATVHAHARLTAMMRLGGANARVICSTTMQWCGARACGSWHAAWRVSAKRATRMLAPHLDHELLVLDARRARNRKGAERVLHGHAQLLDQVRAYHKARPVEACRSRRGVPAHTPRPPQASTPQPSWHTPLRTQQQRWGCFRSRRSNARQCPEPWLSMQAWGWECTGEPPQWRAHHRRSGWRCTCPDARASSCAPSL